MAQERKTKQYYFTVVVDLESLDEIKRLRDMGLNIQPMVRAFIKNKIEELKPTFDKK